VLPYSGAKDARFALGLAPVGSIVRVAALTGYHRQAAAIALAGRWAVARRVRRRAARTNHQKAAHASRKKNKNRRRPSPLTGRNFKNTTSRSGSSTASLICCAPKIDGASSD